MDKESVMKALEMVKDAGDFSAESAREIFTMYANGMFAMGVAQIVVSVALFIASGFCYKTYKNTEGYKDDSPIVFATIIFATFGVITLGFGVAHVIAPEYWALKDILSILGSK